MVIEEKRRATPNDPKLSDGRGWRAGCGVARTKDVEQERAPREVDAWSVEKAASVTAAPVRCSAWLGAFVEEYSWTVNLMVVC